MSGKNFLLDTNIVIGLFANETSIIEKIKTPSSIFIPSIVLGELFYGAEQSTKKEENLKKIDALAQVSLTVECDLETARLYGKISKIFRHSPGYQSYVNITYEHYITE